MSGHASINDHLNPDHLQRLARQILIRTSAEWSGPHAKHLTGWALADCEMHVAPAVFRRIVSVVFRLGRLHPPVPGLFRGLPLEKAEVAEALISEGSAWVEGDFGEWIVAAMHQRLASNSYETVKRVDWVECFNRAAARFEGEESIEVPLLEKCRLSDVVWEIRAQRLERLAEAAAEEHGVTVAEIVDAIIDGYAMAAPAASSGCEAERCDEITHEDQSDWLLKFAPADVRGDLASKLERLPVAARAQLLRRSWWMIREPIAARMWTKAIQSVSELRELKVVAGGSHFRLLYRPVEEGIVLLDLGLRRDLDQMIRGVERGRPEAGEPFGTGLA